jgi:tetratricopeptide (TPR) repeat protein
MTAAAFALILSLSGPSVQGAAPTPATPTEAAAQSYFLFLQARELEDAGKNDDAIAAFKQAITLAPKASGLHAELAALYARAGNASDAVTEAQAALALNPNDRDAHRILGLVQAAVAERGTPQGQAATLMTQAIGHLAQAVSGGLRDPAAELALGRLYLETGNVQKGIDTLQLFLLGTPGYPEAVTLLGQAYETSGRIDDAIAIVAPLLDGSGGDDDTRKWLAGLYERAGRWKDAAAAWGDLATRVPSDASFPVRQAAALVNGGQFDAGRTALQAITLKSPQDIPAWYMLSMVEQRAGRNAQAEDAARHILAIDANDTRGAIALAGAQSSRGDFKAAAATLTPHVTAPTSTEIENGTFARMAGDLAAALEQSNDRPKALQTLVDAQKRDPDDEALAVDLAGAYERGNQIDLAEQTYRQVIARDPQNPDALNGLSYLLANHGVKLDEAATLVQRALVVEQDNPSYLDTLGWVYFKQAKLDLARPPLERAAAEAPQASSIQAHLGDLYFQMKRYRDAVTAYDRALAGDRLDLDVDAVTKQRDRAQALAGGA